MDIIQQLIDPTMFASTIRLAVPIAYAALGAMFCERAGIINIGLEGQLLTASFFSVIATYFSGDPIIGVFGGILSASLVSLLFGALTIGLNGNQIIVGTGVNIAVTGLFGFLSFMLFNSPGVTPTVTGIKAISIPYLSQIPWIGEALFVHTPTVFLLPIVVGLCYLLLYRTPIGLRIRVSGDNPIVDEAAGVNVLYVRYIAVILSGVLTGLGGVNLALEGSKFYQDSLVAGRGFIGLAANIFGGWTPIGGPLISLVFGFARSLMFRVQGLNIPQEFFFMLPYALTLIVMVGAATRSEAPLALGENFIRKE